jgi:WXG100 family type VII secretion target
MTASVVRADYDELSHAASSFDQQAAAIGQALGQVRRQKELLEAGDWMGQGASAFYQEMNAQVVPTLARLVRALEAAAGATRQIRQVAEEAEAEAASCFRLNGRAAGGPAAAGPPPGSTAGATGAGGQARAFMPGPAGPSDGSGSGSGSGSGGSRDFGYKRPTSNAWTDLDRVMVPLLDVNPQLAEQVFKNPALLKRLMGRVRSGYYVSDAKTGGVQKGIIRVTPTTTLPELTQYAATAYDHPLILSELDPKLVAELKKDKVLFQRLRQLDEADWHTQIKMGTTNDLTTYSRPDRTVTIAPNNPIDSIRRGVAQAERAGYEELRPTPTMRPETYLKLNVDQELRRDAAQILHTLRAEQAAVGRMSTQLPTMGATANVAAYHQVVKDFADGKLKEWEAVRNMVDLMHKEPRGVTSAAQSETYYAERWNAFVDSLQGAPAQPAPTRSP